MYNHAAIHLKQRRDVAATNTTQVFRALARRATHALVHRVLDDHRVLIG